MPSMAALDVAVVLAAYLLGTFPTAVLVAGSRVTSEGSGNPGASNVYRLAGAKAGAIVFVGDLAKGALGTIAGRLLGDGELVGTDGLELAGACAVAVVLGHCFPVFRRFRGGKGVATAGGAVLALDPLVAIGAAIVWFLVARVAKRASVASLLAAVGVPVAVVALARPAPVIIAVLGLAGIVLGRHTENITRLVRGEEHTVT